MTCVVLAALACAAPGVAHAHGGPVYQAGAASDPAPTVDGVVTPSEWADAKPYTVAFDSIGNATLRFVHTATDLYVGVVVRDPSPSFTPQFNVFFDSDHDGVSDAGDDRWLVFAGGGFEDMYYDPESQLYFEDGEGSNDLVAAGTISGDDRMFELRHPLCSEDAAHDICASLGATLGINFQYSPGPGTFVNAPGPDVLNPSNNWADLALVAGDVVEPTVDVTAPAAGALLRGTVDVAADVSDNVGVDRVEFRYHGGALPFVDIATDTTPPYEATFDSTQVPNTIRGGGTVYAFAYDAAGNETGVGNAVMVDNPPSRIVFETNRDGNSEIYSMAPNGNDGITRLTNDPAVDSRPSLSPDRSLIAWQRGGRIWLMNSDGTEQHALTLSGDGRDEAPAFSPDGTRIAFHSNREGTDDIWVMNIDGSAQTNLTDAPGNDLNPTWSPDGTELAFDSDRDGDRDIYTVTSSGSGELTNLTMDFPALDADPDWSPDGTKILFVSGRGEATSVWSMNADDGGEPSDVTNAPIFDADPAWSPTGDRIVFTRDSGGQTFNLHLAAADGTTTFPARITFASTTQRNSFPDWVGETAEEPQQQTVTLEPVADTYVRSTDPETAHGTETTFDVFPGASSSCGVSGPAYGLLRFDLSSLPAGVSVTDAKLDLTVDGGYADDGDPSHYAVRIDDNSWSESVTWGNRPADGIVPGQRGPPPVEPTINGTLLSASTDVLGVASAFNANCSEPTGPEVRSFAAPPNRPDSFANAVRDAIGDRNLSLQIWSQACGTPTTVVCQNGQSAQGYYVRYHSREAEDPALRPKLVVTLGAAVDVTSFSATPEDPIAGLAQIELADVPPSVLLAPKRSTNSTPLGETPLGETPLGETPLGETPLGETPLGETSLGLDSLLADLRMVPLSSLPLLREGGWPALLANTPSLASRPLQNVSLGDVFAVTPRLPALDGQGADDITLADLDFSRSSLGDVGAIAFALGNGVTLAELEGAFTNNTLDPDLQRWCTATSTDCRATGILALGIRGAPLGETPLGETPLGETPLGETPLGETPLGETPLGETPLGETPLGETPLGETPLGETPLGETPLGETPLGETPLGETPLGETELGGTPLGETPLGETKLAGTPLGETPLGETPLGETPLGETLISDIEAQSCTTIFVSCPPGTDTIDQHFGDLQPEVTIADLVAVLTTAARDGLTLSELVASLADPNAFTVTQLLEVLSTPSDFTMADVAAIFTEDSGVSLADFVASLPTPNTLTLADLVASLPDANVFTLNDLLLAVLRAGAQWERIDLSQPALARVATGGGSVNLVADVSVDGTSELTFSVKLPPGWTTTGTPSIESVPAGVTSTLDVVDVENTDDGGTRHTLRTQFPVGGDHRFDFDVKPGTTLGPATPTLSVTTEGGTPEAAPPVSVNVQETFEENDTPATAKELVPGSLYLSYLTSADDTDFFRVNVPAAAGTRTTIRLSHLPEDYDLVVYGRQGTDQLVQPGAASPLETPVLGDQGAPITHLTEALPAETLDDLTLLTDRPVLGVSAFRTTEDEAVVAVSDGVPGEYIVQVKGYNGATSVEPYMLRAESKAPRLAPNCQARFGDLESAFAPPRPGVSLASVPADTDTLFLANGPQLAKAGGQGVLDWFSTANTNLSRMRQTGHPSALVRLEDDPAVALAYTEWNRQPCSTSRANAVVRAITDVVRSIRNARPSVRHLVLLGNDTALPFARLDDLTTIANEADYASTFARSDDLYGALFEHRVLSDDPYATTDPIPYLQRQLFVPQLAVGRLVETGPQITGALDRFLLFGGELDPASARTSGYDFLQDGANGVAAAFAGIVGAQQPATNPPLIGNQWTRSTLAGALGTNTGLFGMNGHADHHRLQPAAGSQLFSAVDLPASLQRSVVFSMGCHSGLSASDASVAGPIATDWAQTYAGKGAAAYAGNLGYGYGDTITVAYSEALNVRLAQGLRDGQPIGEALVEAKQGYLANLGLVGVYDEKAMSELALYGLPMWSLAGATPAPPTTPALPAGVTRLSTDPDPVTGLMVDRYRSQPALNRQPPIGQPPAAAGTYWAGPSGVQVTHLRPLQPKVEFPVAADARGVLITGLESPTDQQSIDPVYARPIVDSSAAEPELPFADVAFPAKIQSLVTQQTRTGPRVSAVLVHGQFFSNGTTDAAGDGNQRLFTRVDLDVLRSSGADRLAPRFDAIEAIVPPGSGLVSFTVDAVDLPTETAAGVARVLVAFRDQGSLTWRFLDLRRIGETARWGGSASVSGTRIDYFTQAVDRAGNVAVSTNKGVLFAGTPPVPPSGEGVQPSISASVGGEQIAGWFKPSADLRVEAGDGIAVSVSIDGAGLTPLSTPATVTIDTDGLHTVDVRGSNGYEATLLAPVDTLPPTVRLDGPGATVPLGGQVPLAFACGDTASGVASCAATVDGVARGPGFQVPTTPLGSKHKVRLTATDRVGRSTTQEFEYTVTGRGIVYTNNDTGSGDVYVLPVDAGPSTAPTRLTATSFPEADPVWSPDSQRIAFSSNRDGTWRIYLMDADGTDVTPLPAGTGNALDPAWSPDGTRIAFVSTRSGNFDVWVVNLNGSGLKRLTTDSNLDLAPTWSPQATNQIGWANGSLGNLDIWKMKPDGTGKTRLTTTRDVAAETSWKGDGTIAFARRVQGLRTAIWTMTSAGTSQTRIISALRWDLQPSWLQDGKLVFASGRDADHDFDLYRATKVGTSWSAVRVTNAPGNDKMPNG